MDKEQYQLHINTINFFVRMTDKYLQSFWNLTSDQAKNYIEPKNVSFLFFILDVPEDTKNGLSNNCIWTRWIHDPRFLSDIPGETKVPKPKKFYWSSVFQKYMGYF